MFFGETSMVHAKIMARSPNPVPWNQYGNTGSAIGFQWYDTWVKVILSDVTFIGFKAATKDQALAYLTHSDQFLPQVGKEIRTTSLLFFTVIFRPSTRCAVSSGSTRTCLRAWERRVAAPNATSPQRSPPWPPRLPASMISMALWSTILLWWESRPSSEASKLGTDPGLIAERTRSDSGHGKKKKKKNCVWLFVFSSLSQSLDCQSRSCVHYAKRSFSRL